MLHHVLKVQRYLVQPRSDLYIILCLIKGLWQVNLYMLVSTAGHMTIGSIVTLPWQVHTRASTNTLYNIGLLVTKASTQPIKVHMQLTRGLGLNVLPKSMSGNFLCQLPSLVFCSHVAFESFSSRQHSLHLGLEVIAVCGD